MDRLPDELLAEVLRRLPPRHLAACRAVCGGWRGAIDARGLLLAAAHLLPRPLRGIFINFSGEVGHCFFSRPGPTGPGAGVDATLRFLPGWWNPRACGGVLDHSNGLILYECGESMHVCNPATRRSAPVPSPRVRPFFCTRTYLVFDPTVTLHYSVLFFPDAPSKPRRMMPLGHGRRRKGSSSASPSVGVNLNCEHECRQIGSMDWPPCSYAVQVFSSTTGEWEERHFVRAGDPTVTVSDVWSDPSLPTSSNAMRRYSVYWQQALYLHCRGGFIIRLSLLEDKYMVIRTPESDSLLVPPKSDKDEYDQGHGTHHTYLGKSKLGIYYTALRGYQFCVWTLHQAPELHQTTKWELKHQADLEPAFLRHYTSHHLMQEVNKSWILNPGQKESQDMGAYEWDSSDDSVVDVEEGAIGNNGRCVDRYYGIDLLGYHPCKEIAFLADSLSGFAYNLDNAKLECLGSLCQTCRKWPDSPAPTLRSFIYTPCLYDQLPARNDDE